MAKLLDDQVLSKVAQQVVKSLNVHTDEIVEVRADIAAQEWAYGMALYLESIGGHPYFDVHVCRV
jgi:hypothetical protein